MSEADKVIKEIEENKIDLANAKADRDRELILMYGNRDVELNRRFNNLTTIRGKIC